MDHKEALSQLSQQVGQGAGPGKEKSGTDPVMNMLLTAS